MTDFTSDSNARHDHEGRDAANRRHDSSDDCTLPPQQDAALGASAPGGASPDEPPRDATIGNSASGGASPNEPPRDELDRLLRAWHEESAVVARARRNELLTKVLAERGAATTAHPQVHSGSSLPFTAPRAGGAVPSDSGGLRLNRTLRAPVLRAAAVVTLAVLAVAMIMIFPSRQASADAGVVQVPDGGRLDAVDREGKLIGPCPLEHTDVHAEISGFISRVTVTQKYRNTYTQKVEAVYTFPLSHRAAVDRMRMIVRSGDDERIVEGEVKERTLARQIYESARRDGFVASLLEQERPNIFTQSVANIEPGAEVSVEISYVETLQMRDGRFTFDFPMVVGPRYIPGSRSQPSEGRVPKELTVRRGVILIAPAQIRIEGDEPGMNRSAAAVLAAIERAVPIMPPSAEWVQSNAPDSTTARAIFTVRYPDGSEEPGTLRADRTGEVAGRWFYMPPVLDSDRSAREGAGFAQGTDQVPDAGRITPMPVRPPQRSGHDLSMRVSINTGGPAVTDLRSDLHRVTVREPAAGRATVALERGRTIPNRDFVLSWSLAGGALTEGVLTQHVPGRDGYFLLYMVPPERVEAATIRPRELIFVLDTSGSMSGFPIEKSKEVMTRMLGAMRADDTFNIITFAGDHHVLWSEPRPASEENIRIARDFVQSRQGRGGTEMMKAIEAALRPTDRPIVAPATRWTRDEHASISTPAQRTPSDSSAQSDGNPPRASAAAAPPMRLALFLTDGYVGNDIAIIDAVRRYSGSTRVFSFGIGDSVNRYLLAEMARAGRGAVDFVLSSSEADAAVELFTERVRTPVLTDISVAFEGLETAHTTPPLDQLPDLFDREPLVIAGRYTAPGRGTIRIRGMTAQGPWERSIDVDFPAGEGNSTVAAPIWARLQVDDILRPHLSALQSGGVPREISTMVVRLAEQHRIMSPFTSFVAVERTRVTLGGQPVLVAVPIELPQGVSWEGNFGSAREAFDALRGRLVAVDGGQSDSQVLAFRADMPSSEPATGGAPARRRVGDLGGGAAGSAFHSASSPGGGGFGGGGHGPSRSQRLARSDALGEMRGNSESSGIGLGIGALSAGEAPPPPPAPMPAAALPAVAPTRPESAQTPAARSAPTGSGSALGSDQGSSLPPADSAPAHSPPRPRDDRAGGVAPPAASSDGPVPAADAKSPGSLALSDAPAPDQGQPREFSAESMTLLSRRVEPSLLLAGFESLAALESSKEAPPVETDGTREAIESNRPSGEAIRTAGKSSGAADEPLRVVARFTGVDAALERALAALGVVIEGRNNARGVLVLRVPRKSLVDLGLLPQTIRVEPHVESARSESPASGR